MWTDPLLWLTGLGCVGTVICAAHSPHEGRWEAVSLACLLLINFILYQLAYTDWSPKWALEHWGVNTTSVQLWMLADAIGGCAAIAIAHRFWWGWALWAIAILQICFHAGMDLNLFPAAFYTDVLLNLALLFQLAIFFVIGGRGLGDVLLRGVNRLRLFRGSARSSYPQRSR